MAVGNNHSPVFDAHGFWRDASVVLDRGGREMFENASDRQAFLSAFKSLESSLTELVATWKPPQDVSDALRGELRSRVGALRDSLIERKGIDLRSYWKKDMELAAGALLGAIDGKHLQVRRLRGRSQDVIGLMCTGNFTKDGARRTLAGISECRTFGEILAALDDRPSHRDLLALILEKGTPKAQELVKRKLETLVPEPKPVAKVLRMPVQQPQRPLPRAR